MKQSKKDTATDNKENFSTTRHTIVQIWKISSVISFLSSVSWLVLIWRSIWKQIRADREAFTRMFDKEGYVIDKDGNRVVTSFLTQTGLREK